MTPNPIGFEVARLLPRPEFRRWLGCRGWSSGMAVYAATAGEPAAVVKARMDRPGRHLVVWPDPDAVFGMRVLVVEVP